LIDIDKFFNNDIMSSLVTNLNQQYTGTCKLPTGVFTPPTRRNSTLLLANLLRLVETVAN